MEIPTPAGPARPFSSPRNRRTKLSFLRLASISHLARSNGICRDKNMRTDQWLSLLMLALLMAAFVWGRYRYDVVAAGALLVSVMLGIVPAKEAFSGFADDIVIIVGSALVVSASISRSGIMDIALRRLSPDKRGPRDAAHYAGDYCRRAVCVHQEYWRPGDHDSRCRSDGPQIPRFSIDVSDADVLRIFAGRFDDTDRYVTEHHRLPCTRGNHRPTVHNV